VFGLTPEGQRILEYYEVSNSCYIHEYAEYRKCISLRRI